MITPAVLISGAASILLSTTNRVGRVTDRLKLYTDRFRTLLGEDAIDEGLAAAEKEMIVEQLSIHSHRSRLLLRAMTGLYISILLFVLVSLIIGGGEVFQGSSGLWPTRIAIIGSLSLVYSTLMLSIEIRLSAKASKLEINFFLQQGDRYAQLFDEYHPSGEDL